MTKTTPHHRLLHLRVLALSNVRTRYEPHQNAIRRLAGRPISKLGIDASEIDRLAWRYRRQIAGELWPLPRAAVIPGPVWAALACLGRGGAAVRAARRVG